MTNSNNSGNNSFIKLPKALIKNEKYESLSVCAKFLYSVMLDRVELSEKNGWYDEDNRLYIYFTLEEAMKVLGASKSKCIKVFSELDNENGIGLIEKKRSGHCKPARIYILLPETEEEENKEEVLKEDFCKSEIETSGSLKYELPEVSKMNPIKTYNNKTDIIKTDYISSSPISYNSVVYYDEKKELMKIDSCKREIKKRIDYHVLKEKYNERELFLVIDIMSDCLLSKAPFITVGQIQKPSAIVKKRMLDLRSDHIEYVMDAVKGACITKNIKSYILTSLYNSFDTIDAYYEMKVKQDMGR